MPQLLSRRDDAGWLTPAMADILTQPVPPLPSEEALRAQMANLQQALAGRDAPVRIVDVRPSPSHTFYVVRPDVAGRMGSRRPVTASDVRRALGAVAEQHREWTLGFINRLAEDDDSMGILLRTEQNQPLHLRQILVSNAYISRPSTLSLILGVALQQQAVIRDLPALEHLLVVGAEAGRQHIMNQLLLTMLLFSTPPELRLAFIGSSAHAHKGIAQTPHTLGRLIDTPEYGVRLLDGMVKEAERRRQWLLEHGVETLAEYNARLQSRGDTPAPHVLLVFDSLSDEDWHAEQERWLPAVYDLLVNGARVGIHLLLTANQPEDVPQLIADTIKVQMVMRSANPALAENLKHLHSSALRFTDAFIINNTGARSDPDITPVELCAVSTDDIQRLVAYWRQASIQRAQEVPTPERTGLTGVLRGTTEEPPSRPQTTPPRTAVSTLARATYTLSGSTDERLHKQAQALAAYLGWLGVGPLRDVLGLSAGEARALLEALQRAGVIEEGDSPTLRFIRLAANPLADAGGE